MEEKDIDELMDNIYRAYGSGTGVLFGIPSHLKPALRAVIKVVIEDIEGK